MYPLKIKEKYDQNNLDNLWHRFSVVYMWNYLDWDYKEWNWSHPWVDIVPEYPNQEVFAVLDWEVFKSWEDCAYWKYVFLKHNIWWKIYYSCYQHLSDFFVNVWDIVKEWDIIWKTWNTWISRWEHLHFQIDKDEAPFHAYWPYTRDEIKKAWITFSEWVNFWLWKENVLKYTLNPLVFLDNLENQKVNNVFTIEKEKKIETSEIDIEIKGEKILEEKDIEKLESVENKDDISDLISNAFREDKKLEKIVDNENDLVLKEEKVALNSDFINKEEKIYFKNYDNIFKEDKKSEISLLNEKEVFFKDIKTTDPLYDFYLDLVSKKIISWYPDNTFRPENNITRWEFLKIILLFFNIPLSSDNRNYFVDVSSVSWQKKYVNTRVWLWVISTKNKYFRPNSFITRVEALKIIFWILKIDFSKYEYKGSFLDVKKDIWYANIVEYASQNKLFNFDTNFFYPNKNIKRKEIVYILSKIK